MTTAPPNFWNTILRGMRTSNGDCLLTHLLAAYLLIWKFMNQRLLGLGGQTSHAFSLYLLLLSSNGFATKGWPGGRVCLTSIRKSHTCQVSESPGLHSGPSRPTANLGLSRVIQTVTLSKYFVKYCISCLRSFKMKFSRHPRIYLSTESNETCIKVLMR